MSARLVSVAVFAVGAAVVAVAADPPPGFRLGDANRDGKLSRDEFTKLVADRPRFKGNPDLAARLFDRFDADRDGFLSPDEFRALAESGPGAAKPGNLFRKGDGEKKKEKTDSGDEPRRSPSAFADAPTAEQVAFFEKRVRPVLAEHCNKCHSAEADKVKGGLALDTRDGLRAGGDSGPAVVAGEPGKSLLVKAVRHADGVSAMPPKGKLPDGVIADLEAWVRMGAPDPRGGAAAKKPATEIDVEKGRQFWAFQPPKKAAPPAVKDAAWPVTDVDRFLLAGLEAKGLRPVADADPRPLVRRLALDLTGLPPDAADVEGFATDPSPARYDALVEKYLASPAFGERWGRHWLDVARFAESTGKTVNFNYPHAWRYRDYVIAAFNADKPFDQFAREQLAGDLLPAKDDAEKAKNLVATGFLAVGAKQLNERNRLQFDLDVADEQIDVTTQAFLGMTAACARCHDHKFDPIPMRDYYALAGVFRSTETCYGTIRFVQANHPSSLIELPKGEVPAGVPPLSDRERKAAEATITDVQKRMKDTPDPIRNLFNFAQLSVNRSKLDAYEADGTPKARAMGVRDRGRPTDSPVYVRGEPDKPGEVVPRGVLQVVGTKPPAMPRRASGRLELADWIASADNPLTARVYVNRVWRHLFGRGLVATPDNFGTTGSPPSNQALLDHLAVTLTEGGWSTKSLVRSLVKSRAYRLSAAFDEANHTADPENVLVWRTAPRRLDAEVVRDTILAAAGRLDRTPPVGSVVARAGEGPTRRPGLGTAVRADPADRHRSVYLPIVRDDLPEPLALFDAADPSLIVGDRPTTTVPAQALFLMNNPFVLRNAQAAAEVLLVETNAPGERVRRAYLRFLGRPPTDAEREKAERFVAEYPGRGRAEPWAALCQAMFGSAEFLMRP